MGRRLLLDAFCCSGGATRGYQDAGFYVVGVDIEPQPNYCGDEFHLGDAVDFIARHGVGFDAIHASPPCQRYSLAQRIQSREHPDLVAPTRAALEATGRPWVIENVPGAPLRDTSELCGAMFGLRTYRHRLFEAGGGFAFQPPAHPEHTARNAKMGRPVREGEFIHVVGNFSNVALARQVMGMPWATRDELREAIPVAYTAYVGARLTAHLDRHTAPADLAKAA
jgi:DNA (cytosine-5)-methyltransferase 1